jgi:lysozyme family protein
MTEFYLCAFDKLIGFEGLYSNDPNDRGGETWKGISRNNFPKWEGWTIIDRIKAQTDKTQLSKVLSGDSDLKKCVYQFYYQVFWLALNLDKIPVYAIAEEIFDTAVNQGLKTAARYFQQALNLLNNNQKIYSNILDDGDLGDKTLRAYDAYMLTANYPGRSQERTVKTLLKVMNGLQFERYADICRNSENQEVFFYGWMNRV